LLDSNLLETYRAQKKKLQWPYKAQISWDVITNTHTHMKEMGFLHLSYTDPPFDVQLIPLTLKLIDLIFVNIMTLNSLAYSSFLEYNICVDGCAIIITSLNHVILAL
jgi:16S rRNA G966 N2-methylase RsmD